MITFWRPNEKYGCFSNFSDHSIVMNGKRYKSCEHYYQCMKAINDEDHERVRVASSAKMCKKIAHEVDLRPDWEDLKFDIMVDALRAKAERYEFIKEKLIKTGDEDLGESSPKDYIWGLGEDGTGQNLLGKAWMTVREELQVKG